MGLGGGATRFLCDLWSRGVFENANSICDSGSQELNITAEKFHTIVQSFGLYDYPRAQFANLQHWPQKPKTSARELYDIIGLSQYSCIDLNGEHNSIQHDLNLPLEDKNQWNQFDVVTDYGCNEHCFNVMEAYRTLHRLLKLGGHMVVCQGRYVETNGYFLMDESFYEGLAAANGYKIVQVQYIVKEMDRERKERDQFLLPFNRDMMRLLDLNTTAVDVICCFQKIQDADFVIPYQDDYLSERQNNAGYIPFMERQPPARSYLPIKKPEEVLEWAIQTHRNVLIDQLITRFPKDVQVAIENLAKRQQQVVQS